MPTKACGSRYEETMNLVELKCRTMSAAK